MSILSCTNLTKKYGDTTVLNHIDFQIDRGRIVGLLGKNGAGKTTLIKLINNLLTPDSGEILFDGETPGVNAKSRISYLPERTYLDKQMKVRDSLRLFEDFYADFDAKKARRLLKDLHLDENQQISKMSKGMQEKLQLVLVMSRKADLYILDEPFGGVDPATRDYILDTILSNFDENSSILISTLLIADVERILDDVVFIDGGNIVLSGAADEIRDGENASIDEIFRRMFKC
jgi:ABC-2 type transport system ATP-binding protein